MRAMVALLTVALLLLVVDWILFDGLDLTSHLTTDDIDSGRGKLVMARQHRDARILYLGDSRILTDVDPRVVSDTCRCGPGYNAAFSSSDPVLTRIVARGLLETLSPVVAVVGLSEWSLSDGAQVWGAAQAADFLPPGTVWALQGNAGGGPVLSSALSWGWRAYRYRGELRATLRSALGERPNDFRRGFMPLTYRADTRYLHDLVRTLRRSFFTDFGVTGRRRTAVDGLIRDLQQRDIRVVLIVPPLHPMAREAFQSELQLFNDAVTRLADEQGVVLELMTAAGGETPDFADLVHLRVEGARKLSTHMGRLLAAALPN